VDETEKKPIIHQACNTKIHSCNKSQPDLVIQAHRSTKNVSNTKSSFLQSYDKHMKL